MTNNYSAQQVADWLLMRNKTAVTEQGADFISNLKLQKLLYYAQGAHLGMQWTPLFNEPILAWRCGPVVVSVYERFKDFNHTGIVVDDVDLVEFDPFAESILTQVYREFDRYSAWKLNDMIHAETPWKETGLNCEISIDSIKDYFIENYIGTA